MGCLQIERKPPTPPGLQVLPALAGPLPQRTRHTVLITTVPGSRLAATGQQD